jgi:hypothetical protein
MKERRALRSRVVALIAFGVASLLACRSPVQEVIESVGPSGTYKVRIEGVLRSPRLLSTRNHVITLSAVTRESITIAPFPIYALDFLERGFREKWSDSAWPAENVFQLLANSPSVNRSSVRIILNNKTEGRLPCIQINAEDLIVAFDLAPSSRQELVATLPADSRVCIDVKTRGHDGRVIATRRQCSEDRGGRALLSFEVSVTTTAITIDVSSSERPRAF